MIGIGLSATPTASDSDCPIASLTQGAGVGSHVLAVLGPEHA
jgi:hypothetical protein